MARSRRSAEPRAARRVDKRTARQPAAPPAARRLRERGARALRWALLGVFLVTTAVWLERRITWYLAVDQFGYLTFAHDLLAGRVFHEWPPVAALASVMPPRSDILAQTYVYDHGRLYCRYAPGFPIMLAAWVGLLGDDAAHYLNLIIFLVLLVLLALLAHRLLGSRWRALAVPILVALFPTYTHLWALTPTRDLAAHLFAFAGLFLMLSATRHRLAGVRGIAAAALALGYAVSVRPDAVLYLFPVGLLLLMRARRPARGIRWLARAVAPAALGFAVGIAPLLAYNWIATGSPLRLTQGMELEEFLPAASPAPAPDSSVGGTVGYPSPGWRGGTATQVQGGGLKLANLPRILPTNLAQLKDAYGPLLLGAAAWGVVVASILRPMLALLAVSYGTLALLFYSCWSRPDPRYLIGLHLFLPLLVVEGTIGTLDLVRCLARRRRTRAARALALIAAGVLVVGLALSPASRPTTALPSLTIALALLGAAGAAAAAIWPSRRVVAVVAPVVALIITGIAVARAADGLDRRAAFQRPQMLRARETFRRAVEPGALVITTENLGRPAENIEYYSGVVHALYLTDIVRWRTNVSTIASLALAAGRRPYLLLPAADPERARILAELRTVLSVETVRDVPPAQSADYFVAAPFHQGIRLALDRISWPARLQP